MADGEVDLGSLSDLSELSDPGVDENGAGIGGSGDGPSTSDGRLAGGPASSGQGGSPNVLLYDLHSHLPDWKTLDALHVERPAPFAALRSTVEFVARAGTFFFFFFFFVLRDRFDLIVDRLGAWVS